jgi:hypothetical protein
VAHCIRHYEEPVVALCRECAQAYCGRCLVFAFGPNKPPYCVGCALTASGVRSRNRNPVPMPSASPDDVAPTDKRVERAQARAAKAEAKAAAKAAKAARKKGAPEAPADLPPEPRPTYVPAPTGHPGKFSQPV